jgi:hypothetical protein
VFEGSWGSLIEGNGLSMGIGGNSGACSFCDAEAAAGVDMARNESNKVAVTLPAE